MELEVEIERILPGGVGLAHAEGRTIFVSLAAPGDRLRIGIDRQQGNVLFGSIREILKPSSVRVEPPCPYFGRCGGCDFQQLTYEAQLAAKAAIVLDCLQRIAGLKITPDFVVHPSPSQWRYRARATWQIDLEKKAIGYYESASRRVCDVADCAVLAPELQQTLESVRRTSWAEFPQDLKHLDAVAGENGVSLAPEFDQYQSRELRLTVGAERYDFNARAFFQVNQSLLPAMLSFALDEFTGETAIDLYCGVGLFTVPLARRFGRVTGVEANPIATRFARRNLNLAGIDNATIVTASVGDWTRQVSNLFQPDFILLDPPRAGAESVVIKTILDLQPQRICYVSCDPSTLARDLKKLSIGGYKIDSVAAFDMFPQTHHVETIVKMGRTA